MARFNFIVHDDTGLGDLAKVTRRQTKAEVVRDALSLYQYLTERVQAGDRIFLGKDPQHIIELAVTTLKRIEPRSAVSEHRP
jgi:hypothetical protein